MTEQVDERARHASAAVHTRAADLDTDRGLTTVVRRGRRPRPAATLAVVLALLVAVPGVAWLRGQGDARVELESPADAPAPQPADEDAEVLEEGPRLPEPGDDPTPTSAPEHDPATTDGPEGTGADEQPPAAGTEPVGPFGTAEVSGGDFPFGGGEVALLTDVRVAGHYGFDRVVLELEGGDVPSYRVTYVDPPLLQDGSGEEMHVDGAAFLELRLAPASGVDLGGTTWEPTYEGPQRVTGDTAVVTEVVRLGDFEAHLAWVVGLTAQRPFAVSFLTDPLRLVVDVRSG